MVNIAAIKPIKGESGKIKEVNIKIAVTVYQTYYNLVRANMNKDYMSPWQIIRKEKPKISIELARLPPLMLDWLGPDYATKKELLLRGYDLPCYPCSKPQPSRLSPKCTQNIKCHWYGSVTCLCPVILLLAILS
jgi:hypothetical protein